MNELIFFLHLLVCIGFLWISLKIGKEALISWFVLSAILANVFVIKQIKLFGLSGTCSDVFSVGAFFAVNLLQEYFGKKESEKALKISFCLLLFYLAMVHFHLQYVPTSFDFSQSAFLLLFSSTTRIIIASFCAFFVAQKVNVFFYHFFQKHKKTFAFSMITTIILSEIVDTILFSILGLYGIVESVFSIIAISFFVKLTAILLSFPFMMFAKKLFPKENRLSNDLSL